MSTPLPAGASPFCEHLCSKKLLVSRVLPRTAADVLDRSEHCWCARTQTVLGPDREQAHPEDCVAGRSCFSSPFVRRT